jgi:site-specific recombinase XerD
MRGESDATARRRHRCDRFDTLTAAMGVSGYTTHSLRHQFATEALDDGANIANIVAILGHRTVETTVRIYVTPDRGRRGPHAGHDERPADPRV